jgi:hypothetical protein
MRLSEFKNHLRANSAISIIKSSGDAIPAHFHITEIGLVSKQFIDCGGDAHTEKVVSFQIWIDEDTDHRLKPDNLLKIIALFEKVIDPQDLNIEMEYQTETIGKYEVGFDKQSFVLIPKYTDCLAKEKCLVPAPKNNFIKLENTCTPGGGCC